MKRSNFTFLLFALLSFVYTNVSSQGSCVGSVNLTVGAACDWVIDADVLGATGDGALAAGSGSIVFTGAASGGGNFLAGSGLTGSLGGLPGGANFTTIGGAGATVTVPAGSATGPRLPYGGTASYQLWSGPNGTGTMVCWGELNFEVKRTPETMTSIDTIMCGQDPSTIPGFPKYSDVVAGANGSCSALVENFNQSTTTSGDACTGFLTIRTIRATASIDGLKTPITLRIDTLVETPLDTSMVTCPLGGPLSTDALELDCGLMNALGYDYQSAEAVYAYYKYIYRNSGAEIAHAEAVRRAYPHVVKDTVTVMVDGTPVTTITSTPKDTMLLVNGLWVNVEVVIKDTTTVTPKVPYTYPVVIPLDKGPDGESAVTCNLSVKCTDMHFAGCAGPSTKVMRTWQVLDWCNGSIKECMQWIVVKTGAPAFTSVLGKDTRTSDNQINKSGGFQHMWPNRVVMVDIAPWTCAAQLPLSATASYGCADGSISWATDFGVIGSDNVLRGLWLGEKATVTATATSDCGSHGERTPFTFTVMPVDNIRPVPVAQDQVNVSLTGDPTAEPGDDAGVAKVYVDAIDAGSHNAGCGEVDVCLLLKDELEDPVYTSTGAHMTVNISTHYGPEAVKIYHAKGCSYDGKIDGTPATKTRAAVADIYYVYCKDFVKFCCSDVGENLVALVATNGSGSQAHSWSIVNVEDKSTPIVTCRPNITVACGKDYSISSLRPSVASAVCTGEALEYTVVSDVDACGNGADVYTWTVNGEVVCVNRAIYDGASAFDPYEIKWPKHYTGETVSGVIRECEAWLDSKGKPVKDSKGNELNRIVEYYDAVAMGAAFDCEEGGNTGEPVWCQASCALVGSSFEPLEVEAADACKKIIRQWTVIDWCTWDPNTSNVDDENDTDTDSFEAIDDEWLDAYSPDHAGAWYTDSRETPADAPANYDVLGNATGGYVTDLPCASCDKQNAQADHVYFRYTSVDRDGYYTFDQVIKISDTTAPVIGADEIVNVSITGGAASKGDDFDDCSGSQTITASVSDMCGDTDLSADGAAWWIEVYNSDDDLIKTATSFGATASMGSQPGGHGSYNTIKWQVRDGCGNIGYAETRVNFVDDKQPTPVCIQDLSTAIMPTTGTVEIWAADYDNGSFDNCSEVEYWFLLDENGNPTDDQTTGTYNKNLLVTCDMLAEFGQGETLVLGLYVSDAQLNIDFCNITLNVNGAQSVCDLPGVASANISGSAESNFGDMIESAEIALNVGAKDLTAVDGKYMFRANPLSTSYDIKAEKNDDYMNGVSTLDLVLIQKHVLGLQTLDDSYLLIAADINNDGRVTAVDLVDLRKLILGIYEELPTNDSWRFVDAAHTFDNPAATFPYPEVVNIANLNGNIADQNFIGVKVGDVSGNAIANSALASNRSVSGKLALQIEDATVAAGEMVEVSVSSAGFADIAAYQFTMELKGLEFVSATSGTVEVSESNFGLLDANTVTTAWFASDAVTATGNLFTMTFKATSDVTLSDALALSSRVTDAKAYTSGQDILDVVVDYNTVGEAGFVLGQNTPNPFSGETKIGFELPEAGTATLTVFDVTGKTVSVMTETYGSGYNEVTLRKSELGASGVLYYQLESGDFTATKKMILID